MNREIKFRGKSNHPKSFSYGDFVFGSLITRGELDPLINVYDENSSRDVRVDPNTIGQFTGVLDGRNQEIYENDFVATYFDGHCTYQGEVRFEAGRFIVSTNNGLLTNIGGKSWLVIGNIHDNPELMEAAAK